MKNIVYAIFLGLIMISCAHHRDVRPGADGVHRVTIVTETEEEGARNALAQANHFCKQRKLQAAIIEENQKYTGDIDEATYRKGKRITKAVKKVGGAAWVFGRKQTSDIGGIVGLGGSAGDAALGKGYTVNMKFKCI